MPIKRAKFTSVWFDDAIGRRREIRGLPLGKRRRFIDLQELAGQIIQENPDCSIGYLYDHDSDFQAAIDECLELYGLSSEWCSSAQVMQLFFAYDGGEGLCWQLEFPEPESAKRGKLLNPKSDPYHSAIAALWSYTPELALSEVLETINQIPWIEIEGILSERNRLTEENDPELKKKRSQQQSIDELGERFTAAVESGEFSDGFSAGLAAMLK